MKTLRNVAIVLALAAAVAFVPGGGTASDTLVWFLALAFWGALAWFMVRLYREQRMSLYALGDRMRAVLYGSIGAIVLTLAATQKLWDTGPGSVAWILLLAMAGYGLFSVWRFARRY